MRLFFDLFKLRIGLVIGFTAVAGAAVTPGPAVPALDFLLLAVACTMVDHEGSELGSLHRELAGNEPGAGFSSGRAGTPLDRNVILPVRSPFAPAGRRD